jgi:hypothetical protein
MPVLALLIFPLPYFSAAASASHSRRQSAAACTIQCHQVVLVVELKRGSIAVGEPPSCL